MPLLIGFEKSSYEQKHMKFLILFTWYSVSECETQNSLVALRLEAALAACDFANLVPMAVSARFTQGVRPRSRKAHTLLPTPTLMSPLTSFFWFLTSNQSLTL
jgi:hypothetical protein